MVIRKFCSRRFTIQDLIERVRLTTELANHLAPSNCRRQNGSKQRRNRYREDHFAKHSGISDSEPQRIVVIEDTAELQFGRRTSWQPNARLIRINCPSRPRTCSEAPLDGGLTESLGRSAFVAELACIAASEPVCPVLKVLEYVFSKDRTSRSI
jgi:hypothetical protein